MTTSPVATEPTRTALDMLKLFADDTRWQLVRALRMSDYQVGELVARVKLPQNLVSYHLSVLRQAGLVQTHRSEADARVLYYRLDLPAFQAAYRLIGAELHLAEPLILPHIAVVFLCTGNSARSQMAEGWLRQLSSGRVAVRSAGTEPRPLHPLAVQAMAEIGIDIGYQYAKGVDALPPTADILVTVCDRARATCAPHVAASLQLHWSIPDPVRLASTATEPRAPFRTARDDLRARVAGLLAALPTLGTPAQAAPTTPTPARNCPTA